MGPADQIPSNSYGHVTVLLRETVSALGLVPGSLVVDCTLGGGGHTKLLLEAVGKSGKVLAFDRDPMAIQHAESAFSREIASGQLSLVHKPFSELASHVSTAGLAGTIDGIIADLGVSSPQLDIGERGFSFLNEGPLDMRMDTSRPGTAADLVNTADEMELSRIFRDFGEEPMARHFAKMICRQRAVKPFSTTAELASFVEKHSPYSSKSRRHPATRLFQALRIAVNDELGELDRFLAGAIPLLKKGGRLAVITFHSLEDRAVKHFFAEATGKSKRQQLGRHVALTETEIDRMVAAKGQVVAPYPIEPGEAEVAANPRARSARLRVFEKF
ncbi:16S rRNA (cytosine(1402)-N(4))-methyltransferase RsmH [bacterium]|nr:16S rRNA (cytosine(1402)-N(4))-methyltransferase RsmH [bacterium]